MQKKECMVDTEYKVQQVLVIATIYRKVLAATKLATYTPFIR